MKMPPDTCWAKQFPRQNPLAWHPLLDHCHDVAACFEAIIAVPVIGRRLARLAGRDQLPKHWAERLTVLAFLHDFGKANHSFQDRNGGHIREAAFPAIEAEACRSAGLDALDSWSNSPIEVLSTILTHHGYGPEFAPGGLDALAKHWIQEQGRAPLADVAALVGESRKTWPHAFDPGGDPLPGSPAFWHAFLGLLQLADWLGSDDGPDAFPYTEEEDPPRRTFACSRAEPLLTQIGLDISALREAAGPPPGFAVVSAYDPSSIQRAVGEAAGPIVVMEAETGSGKTEAALYRFARLFMAGRVDGLYFALPTRVAATQMVGRVAAACARLFPDLNRRPPVVLAIPGDAGADGEKVRRLPGFGVEWSDDPDEVERRRRWAAETPKRFLAAPIAVGTIDQALLGAVRVKHAQMRSACLARSLLVVDEVHASDEYMIGLLQNLLKQHLAAGGEALLLSATLGAEARTGLMLSHRLDAHALKKRYPSTELAVATAYPSVSTLQDDRIVTRSAASRGTTKTVRIEPLAAIADADQIAQQTLEVTRAGARVLVIRNTVGNAVEVRQAMETAAPGDPVLFAVSGRPAVHHGRFARQDRRWLDREIEQRLGKDGRRDSGLVVVGTQTLEISLDIDADLMITDLAPMDVLLQRIGRLHRHHERRRPAGFDEPRCLVLMPHSFDAALSTVKRERMGGPHGFGSVYDNLPALAATQRLIGEGADWALPGMNRALVEAATHSEALDWLVTELEADDPRWREAWLRMTGKRRAERYASASVALDWDKPVSEFRVDEHAATRLGTRDVELSFDAPLPGAFGEPVTRLVVPDHLNPSGAFEAIDISATGSGFTFALGGNVFLYDSYGLRRTEV